MANRVRLHSSVITRVVGQKISKAAAKRAATTLQERARQNLILAGRVDTGETVRKIVVRDKTTNPLKPTFEVAATGPASRFNEDGTSDYVAPKGKVLRFKPKGSAVYIFRTKRKGIQGIHFMKRARATIKVQDFVARGRR